MTGFWKWLSRNAREVGKHMKWTNQVKGTMVLVLGFTQFVVAVFFLGVNAALFSPLYDALLIVTTLTILFLSIPFSYYLYIVIDKEVH